MKWEERAACWYWREDNGDWFVENNPSPWQQYLDPAYNRAYWCNADVSDGFWELSVEEWDDNQLL